MPRRPVVLLWLLLLLPSAAQATPAPSTWLVVCSPSRRPALAPLIAHRRAEGLKVVVVDAPAGTPTHRRRAIRARIGKEKPRYVLLVGGATTIPVYLRDRVATDRPYGDQDDDGRPEAAIGRFPTDDAQVIARLAQRIVAYETQPGIGRWRKRCALIAGEGRFSPIVDKLIELVFGQVVRDAIHPGYDVDLTYANPRSRYCFPPQRFADRVAKRIEEGALLVAYVGHGAVRSVDRLSVPNPTGGATHYPVLDMKRAQALRAPNPPVFVAIACSTGRFEGPGRCIGQALLAAPGGPVAFVGATRVSHPVHNALLAKALVGQILAGVGPVRLGPALDRAKHEMVNGPQGLDLVRLEVLALGSLIVGRDAIQTEMQRHVDMYPLLGDPALKLARPGTPLAIRAPKQTTPGAALRVRGVVPAGGQVTITLEVPRDQSARPSAPPNETAAQRYARANDKVVLRTTATCDAEGAFTTTLALPAGLKPGAYWIKAYGGRGQRASLGARRLQVTQ